LVYLRGAYVERSTEKEGKAEDVVHLIGVVAPAGGDDRIRPHRLYLVRHYLRHRIRQGEYDRRFRHASDHVAGDRTRDGKTHEHVGAFESIRDRAAFRLEGEACLVRVHVVRAAPVDHAQAIAHRQVLAPDAEPDVVLGARDRCRAGAVEHHANFVDGLADYFRRVQQRRPGDDRGAVLIVVEHRYAERLPQLLLYVEAVGS